MPRHRAGGAARVALVLAQGHRGVGGVEVERGVGADGRRSAQRHAEHALLLRDELLAHPAADGRSVLQRLGQIDREESVSRHEVALPCRPDDGVALAHQEAVACGSQRQRVVVRRGVVERSQRSLVPAVVHVVQEAAVAARQIDRFQDVEVRPELDRAVRVARRQRQVDNVRIGRVAGVQLEERRPGQPFVRPRVAERESFGEAGLPLDAQSDPCVHALPPTGMGSARG